MRVMAMMTENNFSSVSPPLVIIIFVVISNFLHENNEKKVVTECLQPFNEESLYGLLTTKRFSLFLTAQHFSLLHS